MLNRKAHAQSAPPQIFFSPSWVDPPEPDAPGIHRLTVQMFLPAVQRTDRPFQVHAHMGDGSVVELQPPPDPERSMATFDIFLTRVRTGGFTVHLRNRKTGEEATAFTTSHEIDPCWMPALNSDGFPIFPISTGETVSGRLNTRMADGSVLPIPFQYAQGDPPGG